MGGGVSYAGGVRTVTVELPDELADAAEQVAASRGVTLEALAREALAERVEGNSGHRFGFVGIAASGDGTLSENYKQIRRAEFGS